jgi:hypothetical protein
MTAQEENTSKESQKMEPASKGRPVPKHVNKDGAQCLFTATNVRDIMLG